ncbi:hypothetical protein MAPG_08972 [Magnaporthiopsis poae ATCC 64411]|uniref:Uncharacterized protein n=1 Tax=Magnaporthiopsis poae (strain ATCC 64411 / 73-15) TaxID=644358 RepID=A0A0C4E8Q6_MAGP6|nr:hypothetical protein MAPG_08972 [Magnaporthiopsis poae ATCC 64411]
MRRGDRQHVILWLLRHGGGAQVVRYGKENSPRACDWARDLQQQALVCAIRNDDEVAARRLVEAGTPLDGIEYEAYPAVAAAELAQRVGAEAVAGYLAGLPGPSQGQGEGNVEHGAPTGAAQDGPGPLLGRWATPELVQLRRMLPVVLFLFLLAVLEASQSILALGWHILRQAEAADN